MYAIQYTVFLNHQTQCYEKILSIEPKPSGSLSDHIRTIRHNKLSIFDDMNYSNCRCNKQKTCFNTIINPEDNEPYCMDQLPQCIALVMSKGYKVDYKLSKLFTHNPNYNNKYILCYITEA